MTNSSINFLAGYKAGYVAALETYAWWKDGEQLVGCGVRSLKEVREQFMKEMDERIARAEAASEAPENENLSSMTPIK